MRPSGLSHRLLTPLLLACLLPACAPSAPRMRLGSLPFPGIASLYAPIDPADIRPHQADSLFAHPDAERGTLYTCRAGFLDLSHVREYTDFTRFVFRAAEPLLLSSGGSFSTEWSGALVTWIVTPPPALAALPETDRRRLAREIALRAAQRAAVQLGTYHELATWHGYSTIPGISEQRSAFTWDDTTSHLVAARVGARALRSPFSDWDHAVTWALHAELLALHAAPRHTHDLAVDLTRGLWFKDGRPLRRDLDTGLDPSTSKVPWTVPGLPWCQGLAPLPLGLPTLDAVEGLDARDAVLITFQPSAAIAERMTGQHPPPTTLVGEQVLLDAVERLRRELSATTPNP